MDECAGLRRPSTGADACFIPDSLAGEKYQNLPLCMLVAWWIFLRQTPTTVREVSEAFHISARRAGDLLLYIGSLPHIDSERHWIPAPSGRRRRAVTVSGIRPVPGAHRRGVVARRPPVKQNAVPARQIRHPDVIRSLRRWMLSRRAGDTVPGELIAVTDFRRG